MSRLLWICGMLVFVGCESTAREGQGTSPGIESEVTAFLESYRSALDRRDGALLATLYVSDGRFEWLEDGSVRYRAAEEIIASLASFPAGMRLVTDYDQTSIRHVGRDGASVTTAFRTTIGEADTAFEFSGVISMSLERGPSGWQIVSGHTSTADPDGR